LAKYQPVLRGAAPILTEVRESSPTTYNSVCIYWNGL